MTHLISMIFRRFFADRNGVSRGWQVFLILTFFGIAMTIWVAWKANQPGQPRFHPTLYLMIPLMFVTAGAIIWTYDSFRRRRFKRGELTTGVSVDAAIATVSSHNKRSAGWVLAFLGATFLPAVLILFGGKIVAEYASLSWTPTTCKVLRCEMDRVWGAYGFRITVTYDMNGAAHQCVVGAPTRTSVTSECDAKAIETKFQAGTQHPIYVNPRYPQEATLRRGPNVGAIVGTFTIPVLGYLFVSASLRYMFNRHAYGCEYHAA